MSAPSCSPGAARPSSGGLGCDADSPGGGGRGRGAPHLAPCQLQEPKSVARRVGEEGDEGEAGVDRIVDLHALRAQVGDLGRDVAHAPVRLGRVGGRAGRALRYREPDAVAASVGDELVRLGPGPPRGRASRRRTGAPRRGRCPAASTSTGWSPSMRYLLGRGYSEPRISRGTRGIPTQVMPGTAITVLIASRSTTGRSPISGAVAIRVGPAAWGRRSLEPLLVLRAVQPPLQVLARVEPVHDPVVAGRRAGRTEHLHAEEAGRPLRRRADALEERLVGRLVPALDPPRDLGRDRLAVAHATRSCQCRRDPATGLSSRARRSWYGRAMPELRHLRYFAAVASEL